MSPYAALQGMFDHIRSFLCCRLDVMTVLKLIPLLFFNTTIYGITVLLPNPNVDLGQGMLSADILPQVKPSDLQTFSDLQTRMFLRHRRWPGCAPPHNVLPQVKPSDLQIPLRCSSDVDLGQAVGSSAAEVAQGTVEADRVDGLTELTTMSRELLNTGPSVQTPKTHRAVMTA